MTQECPVTLQCNYLIYFHQPLYIHFPFIFSYSIHMLKHAGAFSEKLNYTVVLLAYRYWDVNNLDRLTSSKHLQEISTSVSWMKEMYKLYKSMYSILLFSLLQHTAGIKYWLERQSFTCKKASQLFELIYSICACMHMHFHRSCSMALNPF